MPEETDKFIRIPVATRQDNDKIRTITISESKGILALYAVNRKKILTYLFQKSKGWTMAKAQAWVNEHKGDKMPEMFYTKAYAQEVGGENVFVASDDIEDREGETLATDGWQLENFKKNPQLLWAHRHDIPNIGRAHLRTKTIDGKKKLTFKPEFHLESEESKLIATLVERNFIKASSVGFRPLDQEGNKVLKQELLEISFVNVPANPNALALAHEKGFSEKILNKIFTGELKGTIPFKATPKAPEDTAWDAGAEVKAAEISDLKVMCTAIVGDPENKTSYKLPHHKASGGHPVVFNGVRAAMAAIMGARGGVQGIDRKACYNHIIGHYRQFDKEIPEFKDMEEKQQFNCECISCGYKMASSKHCSDIKCPECGGEMRRAERPGPGKEFEEINEKLDRIEKNISDVAKGMCYLRPVTGTSGNKEPVYGRAGKPSDRTRRILQAVNKIIDGELRELKDVTRGRGS